jgi:hypothetical protein
MSDPAKKGCIPCTAAVPCPGAKEIQNSTRAGFTEDSFQPVIWIERRRIQAFSENVIGDHDVAWLNERLAETVPEAEFWFYFRDLSDNPLKDCKLCCHDSRWPRYCLLYERAPVARVCRGQTRIGIITQLSSDADAGFLSCSVASDF